MTEIEKLVAFVEQTICCGDACLCPGGDCFQSMERGKAVAVIRRTLEFAAGEIYPTHRRACACTRCDCGNSGDAQSVADWDARQDCSNHLRSLSPKAEPNQ